jgi:pimeloyl-ACP methyl ester carboxylesterase
LADSPEIRRGFVGVPGGQIHFRRGGSGGARPLVLLHSNPGSSAMLIPLMRLLAAGRPLLAPDTPGLGDSTPLPMAAPEIADFAAATLAALDALGIAEFDLYGTHTGANMAIEIALARPHQTRHVILDAIALYTPELRQDLLAHYAVPFPPDLEGKHLLRAWHFVRDQWVFWPWFRRDARHRRVVGLPDAQFLHEVVVDVLKASTTYHLAYRASFVYAKEDRLPLLRCPVLMACSASDIFFADFERVAALVPGARTAVIHGAGEVALAEAAGLFHDFLESQGGGVRS